MTVSQRTLDYYDGDVSCIGRCYQPESGDGYDYDAVADARAWRMLSDCLAVEL